MENTKYGKRKEGRWTPIRAKTQDTRASPNSWETHLVRKRWDIGLLRELSLLIMMMMMIIYFTRLSKTNHPEGNNKDVLRLRYAVETQSTSTLLATQIVE